MWIPGRSGSFSNENLAPPRPTHTLTKSHSVESLRGFEKPILPPPPILRKHTDPLPIHRFQKPLPPPPLHIRHGKKNQPDQPQKPHVVVTESSTSSIKVLRRSPSSPDFHSPRSDIFFRPAAFTRSNPDLGRVTMDEATDEETVPLLKPQVYTPSDRKSNRDQQIPTDDSTNVSSDYPQQSWLTLESRNNSVDDTNILHYGYHKAAEHSSTINYQHERYSCSQASLDDNDDPLRSWFAAMPVEQRRSFSLRSYESTVDSKAPEHVSVKRCLRPSNSKAMRLMGMSVNSRVGAENGHSRHWSDHSSFASSSPCSPPFRRIRGELEVTPLISPSDGGSFWSRNHKHGQKTPESDFFVEDYHDLLWDQLLDDRLDEKANHRYSDSPRTNLHGSERDGSRKSISHRTQRPNQPGYTPHTVKNLKQPMMWLDDDDSSRKRIIGKRDKFTTFLGGAFSQRLGRRHHHTRSLSCDKSQQKRSSFRLLDLLSSSREYPRGKEIVTSADENSSVALSNSFRDLFASKTHTTVKKSQISHPLPLHLSTHAQDPTRLKAAAAAAGRATKQCRAHSNSCPVSPTHSSTQSCQKNYNVAVSSSSSSIVGSLPYPPKHSPLLNMTCASSLMAPQSLLPSPQSVRSAPRTAEERADEEEEEESDSDTDPFITKIAKKSPSTRKKKSEQEFILRSGLSFTLDDSDLGLS